MILLFSTNIVLAAKKGSYEGPPPNDGMSDHELEVIVNTGNNQDRETAEDILEGRHRQSRKAALEQMIAELQAELNSIYTNHNTESDANSINTAINQAMAELKAVNQEIAAAQNNNTNSSKNSLAKKDSDTSGDPVRITTGSYLQNETDFIIGFFEIKRKYDSENIIDSSTGYSWISSLDQRIILGINPEKESLTKYEKLKSIYTDLTIKEWESTIKILSDFKITSIITGKNEIQERMTKCNSIETRAREIDSEGGGEVSVGPLLEDIHSKQDEINNDLNSFEKAVQNLEKLRAESVRISEEIIKYKAEVIDRNSERKLLNKKAMFTGCDACYEETGLNTLTVIDDDGNPHLMYETADGSGVWKNDDDKEYLSCQKVSGGYKVLLKDGTVKNYDDSQFLVKITDRNGNWVEIERAGDERITEIKCSDNEHYTVEYSGTKISRITNLRDITQNVTYTYDGNKLVGVKDGDGDRVTMTYDENSRMTALNKCDGSTIHFEYGEVTADGKFLTTSTTNEEGFSEHFAYDRSRRKTTYTDHDGNVTVTEYDGKHRTVREVLPDGSVKTFEYDSEGNLIRENVNGDVTAYSYDSRGNRIRASYSDESYENWSYDNYSLITTYTDRNSVSYNYERDNNGNLTAYSAGGKTLYEQVFNPKGQVTKRTVYGQNAVVTDFEYDAYGNVKSSTCGGIKTDYEYDSRNRLTKITTDGKVIREYFYEGKIQTVKSYNGLETTYITNGRKDVEKIIQKDIVTGTVHQTRIEYDRRHLPVRVFMGNGEREKLVSGCLYTPEGKIKAEIQYGKESFITYYEYKNGQISEVKKIMVVEPVETTITEAKIKNLIAQAGGNVFTQKYDYRNFGQNKKLLTVTDGLGIANLFEYDSFGNLVKTTDGNGEVTVREYDRGQLKKEQGSYGGWYDYGYTDGYITSTKEAGGAAVTTEYYPDGSLKKTTDRYGKVTSYNYDGRGNVSSVISENHKVWYEYDNFDRMTKQVVGNSADESSSVYYITYEYSEDGRTVTVTEGAKYKTTNELDAFGNVIKQTDGNGNERSFIYDSQNRRTESYDGYGNKTACEYNALGQVSGVTDVLSNKTAYFYNLLGNCIKVTDGEGTVYSADYDKAGRLIKERRRGDVERTYEYDNAGRVTKVMCGGQIVESYTYGAKGRTVTVTDGNGKDYLYNYSEFGRLTSEKNRLGDIKQYFYDTDGALESQNNFDGSTSSIIYNTDRTERRVVYSDGHVNRFIYDVMGNIILAENEYGTTEYTYDRGGKLIKQSEKNGETVTFSYDASGNRIKLAGAGQETSYRYGKNNELLEVFDRISRNGVTFSYDKTGKEIKRTLNNGNVQYRYYDKAGRIVLLKTESRNRELLFAEGYVYGADGKRSAKVTSNGEVTLYEYDSQGRLSIVWNPATAEMEKLLTEEAEENGLPTLKELKENKYLSGSIQNELSALVYRMNSPARITPMQLFIKEQYSYDGNGNRITKTTAHGTIKYWYDEENRLLATGSNGVQNVKFSYDRNGNLLKKESKLKTTTYAYNSENRIVYSEVSDIIKKTRTVTNYAYDALGRRLIVQDNGGTALRSVYDAFTFDVLKEAPTYENGLFTNTGSAGIKFGKTGKPTGERYRYLDDDHKDGNRYYNLEEGSWKNVSSRYTGIRNVLSANNEVLSQFKEESGSEYFIVDEFGSVKGTSDGYGNLNVTYSYDAFGALVSDDSSVSFGYAGKAYDQTTGLYNFGYRDYLPISARFTTQDPIRDGANWFVYCNGDPVNFVDLWGLCKGSDEFPITANSGWDYDSVMRAISSGTLPGGYGPPTDSRRITSDIGGKTPLQDIHTGIDIGAKNAGVKGDPIYAVADGKVLRSGKTSNSGSTRLEQTLPNTKDTAVYQHADFIVKEGETVKKGQVIGYMSDKGTPSQVHLHFEIRKNGEYAGNDASKIVDPKQYLPPSYYLEK